MYSIDDVFLVLAMYCRDDSSGAFASLLHFKLPQDVEFTIVLTIVLTNSLERERERESYRSA